MKSLLLMLGLMAGIVSMQTVAAKSIIEAQNSVQSVTLDVQNMTCSMCKYTIKKALQAVDGVQKVAVDFDSKTASVTFDPTKTQTEALIKATTDAGYPATVRQSN